MALSLRQTILKHLYPLFMWVRQRGTKVPVLHNARGVLPPQSFYGLSVTLSNGKSLSFEKLKGKKVLLVNTASDCGFTHQYTELQKLYRHTKEEVEIIAFPANDFREQEKGSDEEIAKFCGSNYGVSFPVLKKSVVVKTEGQHPVYQWLTSPEKNGWNKQPPTWNFAKYLVNEEGILTHYFEPSVSPLSREIVSAVNA